MLDEYDFRGGVRGKYAKRYAQGTNLVLLEPDVAKVFPNSRSVNKALRSLSHLQFKNKKNNKFIMRNFNQFISIYDKALQKLADHTK